MMHMIKYTFTSPISRTEVAALAIRHWPMPCVIEIRNEIPHRSDGSRFLQVKTGRKYVKPFKWFKFNRARKATSK